MCLTNNIETVKKLLASKQEVFTCYKLLSKLYPIPPNNECFLKSPFRKMFYKVGVNKSSSTSKRANLSKYILHKGIHVYRRKEWAKMKSNEFLIKQAIVVRFTAMKKHLLGANATEMVFSEVTLDEKEYKKHTKKRS